MPADLSRLVPTHLIPQGTSSADLKAAVQEQQGKAAAPPEDARKVAMRERSYTFQFRHEDGRGKVWEGTFTHRVPDLRTRTSIGVLRAQLAGGASYDSLDPLTQELCLMVAHLSFTLEETGRPEWAKDLLKLEVPAVLRALWEEASEHERTFLGL